LFNNLFFKQYCKFTFIHVYYSGEIVTNGIVTDVASGIDNIKSFYFGKFKVNNTIRKNLMM